MGRLRPTDFFLGYSSFFLGIIICHLVFLVSDSNAWMRQPRLCQAIIHAQVPKQASKRRRKTKRSSLAFGWFAENPYHILQFGRTPSFFPFPFHVFRETPIHRALEPTVQETGAVGKYRRNSCTPYSEPMPMLTPQQRANNASSC